MLHPKEALKFGKIFLKRVIDPISNQYMQIKLLKVTACRNLNQIQQKF